MISKKVLGPALTGTGAVGATGSLAWALGLFDGEGLDDVGERKEPPNSASKPIDSVSPGGVRVGQKTQIGTSGRQTIANEEMTGATAISRFFNSKDATESDKKVINESLTWRVEWTSGTLTSLWIKAEDESFTWGCRLKPISIKEINTTNDSEFVRQGEELINAIRDNNIYREKFVENCSRSRGGEWTVYMGEDGEIELEAEKDSNGNFKFKDKNGYFKKLWTEDFTGLYKLSKEDENLLDLTEEKWDIVEIKEGGEGKRRKVKISLKEINKNWICHISGNYSGNNLGGKTFKKEELERVLKKDRKHSFENEVEWKRYLFRNCRKNGMNIEGLKIKVTGSNWEFDDASVKKITEGMYENPSGRRS